MPGPDRQKTIRGRHSMNMMDVGMDLNAPVAKGAYKPPYEFTGTINSVTIDLNK